MHIELCSGTHVTSSLGTRDANGAWTIRYPLLYHSGILVFDTYSRRRFRDHNVPSFACYVVQEWHENLAHIGESQARESIKAGIVPACAWRPGIGRSCLSCATSKITNVKIGSNTVTDNADPGQVLYFDVTQPLPSTEHTPFSRYLLIGRDKASKYIFCEAISERSQVSQLVFLLVSFIDKVTHGGVAIVRTDGANEFATKLLIDLYAARGIVHQISLPHSSSQNSTAERTNRVILERTNAVMLASRLPNSVYGLAARYVALVHNNTFALDEVGTTPAMSLGMPTVSVSHFIPFGAVVAAAHLKTPPNGGIPRGFTGIFCGYSNPSGSAAHVINEHLILCDVKSVKRISGHDFKLFKELAIIKMPARTPRDRLTSSIERVIATHNEKLTIRQSPVSRDLVVDKSPLKLEVINTDTDSPSSVSVVASRHDKRVCRHLAKE